MTTKVSAEQVIEQIKKFNGNLSAAAKALGVDRTTIYNMMQSKPTIKKALETARETMIDHVESKLYSKALDGEGWAVCFFLKTQGKNRGYVERSEVTGRDGEGIRVSIDYTNQLAHKLNRIADAGAATGVSDEPEQ